VGPEERYRSRNSIFHAPAHNKYGRGSDFEPKLVSIGPYYHGRENLKTMEKVKPQCMSNLLKQHPTGASMPDDMHKICTQFMRFESYARVFYKEEFNHFSDFDFVRMLVLDSFFIIRIILSLSKTVQKSMPIIDRNIKEVRSDLLLLENQIPLFFIREVYDWLLLIPRTDSRAFPPFECVLKPFICIDMPWRINPGRMSSGAAHLLDLYWRCSSSPKINKQLSKFRRDCFQRDKPTEAVYNLPICTPKVIANATALHQVAGIKFEKSNFKLGDNECASKLNSEGNYDGFDVIFSNGTMRMPCMTIDSSQTTLLLNLIAFENSVLPSMRTFSIYLKLMDELIDSEKDVELLQQSGVINNTLSSHEMAATFFNDIGNFCFIDYSDHFFFDLFRDVQKYYDSSWNRKWASLQQNYFSSPWAVISVFAGVTLLILAGLQTFYTIYPYYNP